MKDSLIKILICPSCHEGPLKLKIKKKYDENYVIKGKLVCSNCGREFPVFDDIPILLNSEEEIRRASDRLTKPLNKLPLLEPTRKSEFLLRKYSKGLSTDVGCGSGAYTNAFNGDIVSVDIIPEFLLKTRENYHGRHNLFCVVANATNLPFKHRTFDFVFCSSVLEHLEFKHFAPTIITFERICKDGGAILIDVPNESKIINTLRAVPRFFKLYPSQRMKLYSLLHRSKFKISDLEKHGFSIHGCIGWVTRKHVPVPFILDFIDFVGWHIPALGGTIIGIKTVTKNK